MTIGMFIYTFVCILLGTFIGIYIEKRYRKKKPTTDEIREIIRVEMSINTTNAHTYEHHLDRCAYIITRTYDEY